MAITPRAALDLVRGGADELQFGAELCRAAWDYFPRARRRFARKVVPEKVRHMFDGLRSSFRCDRPE